MKDAAERDAEIVCQWKVLYDAAKAEGTTDRAATAQATKSLAVRLGVTDRTIRTVRERHKASGREFLRFVEENRFARRALEDERREGQPPAPRSIVDEFFDTAAGQMVMRWLEEGASAKAENERLRIEVEKLKRREVAWRDFRSNSRK